MAKEKRDNKIYKKWYFLIGAIGVIFLALSLIFYYFYGSGITRRITICTEMDYYGDIGPCIKKETVEIVTIPDNQDDCPINTRPAYNIVGGFVGREFVGCVKK